LKSSAASRRISRVRLACLVDRLRYPRSQGSSGTPKRALGPSSSRELTSTLVEDPRDLRERDGENERTDRFSRGTQCVCVCVCVCVRVRVCASSIRFQRNNPIHAPFTAGIMVFARAISNAHAQTSSPDLTVCVRRGISCPSAKPEDRKTTIPLANREFGSSFARD